MTLSIEQISKMKPAEVQAMLAAMSAKLAAKTTITCKVSAKGALSVYGLGRFPVTLYRSQWERLFGATDQVKAFIEANPDTLTTKD